ncbi:MAG: TrmH family RNA methyltransferase [Anaerolineaceae bacterium]
MMTNKFAFLECTNLACGFRFPLDLTSFKGEFCPRCGSALHLGSSQYEQWTPEWDCCGAVKLVGILDNIRSAHNVGSIFRTAEAVCIRQLYLCGLTPVPEDNRALAKAALGAENRVSWSPQNNAVRLVTRMKAEGSQIIALECLPEAENIFALKDAGPLPEKVAVVVGSELAGIDPEILALSDRKLYIPMAGKKSSINVAVAFGIAVYQLLHS